MSRSSDGEAFYTEVTARHYGQGDKESSTELIHLQNHTTQPREGTQGRRYDWILCEATSVFFSIISLYLLASALHHSIKQWRGKRMLNGNREFLKNGSGIMRNRILTSTSSTRSLGCQNAASKKTKRNMNILCLASAIFIVLRSLFEQTVLFFSEESDEVCGVIADVLVVLYACPIATIYLFLWFRQRFLYQQPALQSLSPRAVKVVSGAILVVMSVGMTATALVFILAITYKPDRLGCTIDKHLIAEGSQWAMVMVFTAAFQVSLLGLFVMPLIRHRSSTQSLRTAGEGRGLKLTKMIKRICLITSVCMASDLIAGLVTLAIPIPIVSNLIYDLNLIVNFVGITCTFKNWKRRLFSFFVSDEENQNQWMNIASVRENGQRRIQFGTLHSMECERDNKTAS